VSTDTGQKVTFKAAGTYSKEQLQEAIANDKFKVVKVDTGEKDS